MVAQFSNRYGSYPLAISSRNKEHFLAFIFSLSDFRDDTTKETDSNKV
ncbi:hypothetical protein P872_21310 [Rhodonellum psychrophilum GCM71 = DSM 17998]|uniref:Uncharacterized protein n=1 Tax=Rhodonellum psychrophilum GCM71 = DSM 17998 TaxID=1123057 RepID=U5BJU6_9BACT|nr:hypothetical protein P872_21310 [Rhodonellum psychrophilum GCM71 = DSM 17998]